MRLKTSYTAREVAALTGLTARQLQGWDAGRIFPSAIAPRRTTAGGFTERRYSPVDLLELLALAELRRRGFAPAELKRLIETLQQAFRRRLSETLDDAGEVRLFTDGRGLFLRTRQGHSSICSSIPPNRSSPAKAGAQAGHRKSTSEEEAQVACGDCFNRSSPCVLTPICSAQRARTCRRRTLPSGSAGRRLQALHLRAVDRHFRKLAGASRSIALVEAGKSTRVASCVSR
jgi:DNA-binding transcriptional MerR regulator